MRLHHHRTGLPHGKIHAELRRRCAARRFDRPPLPEAQAWLARFGYVLFGIYEQTPEWSGEPRLRFSNALFVSSRDMARRPRDARDRGFFPRRHAAMLASSRADRTRRG